MTTVPLYPASDPHQHGMLDVGDGHRVHWELAGNPTGKPAVLLHGGPGSGSSPGWRRYFDTEKYRVVSFDQRGCGRSTPHASDSIIDLSTNTTEHLLRDIERLREHLDIDRWLVFGGSWGSTLGLAYAEEHPGRVSELVLFSIALTTRRDVDWITRQMGRIFPEQWQRFRDEVPAPERNGNLAAAYSRLLRDPDPSVRESAAKRWCAWEDTHVATAGVHEPDPRYADPWFRMAFARLVTHYWSHAAWLEEDALILNARKLADIPGRMVHGRLDVSSPLDAAWLLAQAWPSCELVVVEDAGHGTRSSRTQQALRAATDFFSERR